MAWTWRRRTRPDLRPPGRSQARLRPPQPVRAQSQRRTGNIRPTGGCLGGGTAPRWKSSRRRDSAKSEIRVGTREDGPMIGQSAVATLRAYGYDARSDGLGNVQAKVWHRRADRTQTWLWADVPTDGPGLLRWLGGAMSETSEPTRSRAASLPTAGRPADAAERPTETPHRAGSDRPPQLDRRAQSGHWARRSPAAARPVGLRRTQPREIGTCSDAGARLSHATSNDRAHENHGGQVYTHLTEIEADYRRDRIAEEYRSAQHRLRRPRRTYQERRWGVVRRHTT